VRTNNNKEIKRSERNGVKLRGKSLVQQLLA
jgi:hypothetical protein